MARTYRRRRADPSLRALFVSDPAELTPWEVCAAQARDAAHLVARETACYHGDHLQTLRVPTWIGRQLHREHKRADHAELQRCLRIDCFDDHTPVPRRKGARHYGV